MTQKWQHRRSGFNHDWMKNRFLTAIASFVNILDDLVEDPETESRFVRETLSQWPGRAVEASRLIDDFESEMSPRTLFQQPPLCRCGSATRSWLPDLVHQLWRHRLNIDAMCADAREALVRANEAYEQVIEAVGSCADPSEAKALRPFRDRFETLRAACEQFSRSISRFPGRIEVV